MVCGALGVFDCFNLVKLAKGENELEMVEQVEKSDLGAARKCGGSE